MPVSKTHQKSYKQKCGSFLRFKNKILPDFLANWKGIKN
jgi:hypothetical protein